MSGDSTTVLDKDEDAVGIVSFLSPDAHGGFTAVLKARYSDFIVHEVGRDGEVAKLESLEVPEDMKPPPEAPKEAEEENNVEEATAQKSRKRKLSADDDKETPTGTEEQEQDSWSIALSKLSNSVGSDCAERTITMLRYWDEEQARTTGSSVHNSHTQGKYHIMPALPDKQARRTLHELVRSKLSFCALADTEQGRVRIWHKRFEKEMPNYGKFDRNGSQAGKPRKPKAQWPSDRPDYLQFVLYKENVDTSVATKEVTRRLSQGGKRKVQIGYAGMKDKRGVTSQFCTLYRQDPFDLLWINEQGQGGGNTSSGRVGAIRVGNFRYVPKEIRMGALKGNRFHVTLRNVEVLQKADTDSTAQTEEDRVSSTETCLENAARAFRELGFINYFGMQRFGKYIDTHKVGIAVVKGDFESAVNIIMRPKPDEQLRSAKARNVWARRFDAVEDIADREAKATAESSGAKESLKDMGRFMTCEVAILQSLLRKPLDYKRAFCCIPKSLRLMFLHALQSYVWNRVASQRVNSAGCDVIMGDLVLIEDKDEAGGGSGTSGLNGKKVKVVDADDVAKGKVSIVDVVLPLIGTKVQYPTSDMGSLFEKILEELGLRKEQLGSIQDRELKVGGDYRKLICRPAHVEFNVVQYTDPLQPLLPTDLMLMKNEPLETMENAIDESKDVIFGMSVEFTLPPSSYATIALRELMKRPTSSNYQSQLRLERPSNDTQ